MKIKICPKCNKPISYNSYFGAYICNDCGWEKSNKNKHGKWLPTRHPDQKRCSVCDVISFIALYPCINKADYCPHCGAKMDKE